MNLLSRFALVLLALTFVAGAVGKDNDSAAAIGSFVVLKQSGGSQFRAFIAGPTEAKAAVLIVHDYLGITDATKQSVTHLGALGYRAVAVDLYGGKSATSHEDAVSNAKRLETQEPCLGDHGQRRW